MKSQISSSLFRQIEMSSLDLLMRFLGCGRQLVNLNIIDHWIDTSFKITLLILDMIDLLVSFMGVERQIRGSPIFKNINNTLKDTYPALRNREFIIEAKDADDEPMLIETQDDLDTLLEQLESNKLICTIMLKGEQSAGEGTGEGDSGEEDEMEQGEIGEGDRGRIGEDGDDEEDNEEYGKQDSLELKSDDQEEQGDEEDAEGWGNEQAKVEGEEEEENEEEEEQEIEEKDKENEEDDKMETVEAKKEEIKPQLFKESEVSKPHHYNDSDDDDLKPESEEEPDPESSRDPENEDSDYVEISAPTTLPQKPAPPLPQQTQPLPKETPLPQTHSSPSQQKESEHPQASQENGELEQEISSQSSEEEDEMEIEIESEQKHETSSPEGGPSKTSEVDFKQPVEQLKPIQADRSESNRFTPEGGVFKKTSKTFTTNSSQPPKIQPSPIMVVEKRQESNLAQILQQSRDESSYREQSRFHERNDQPHPALNHIPPPAPHNQSMAAMREREVINVSIASLSSPMDLDRHLSQFRSIQEQLQQMKRLYFGKISQNEQLGASLKLMKRANNDLARSVLNLGESHDLEMNSIANSSMISNVWDYNNTQNATSNQYSMQFGNPSFQDSRIDSSVERRPVLNQTSEPIAPQRNRSLL